jgi:hypothetical protein
MEACDAAKAMAAAEADAVAVAAAPPPPLPAPPSHAPPQSVPNSNFRLFTKESITKIEKRIAEDKIAAELQRKKEEEEREKNKEHEKEREEEKPRPTPALEQGKPLPTRFGDFPKEYYGKPIEEIDDYYLNQYVSSYIVRWQRCRKIKSLLFRHLWSWRGTRRCSGSAQPMASFVSHHLIHCEELQSSC